MKLGDWADWVFIILLLGAAWVYDDPRRAGHVLSDIATEFQIGVEEGRQ